MGTQLYRSEGPACMAEGGMIIGGCPAAPGIGTVQTSFNISQAAPFAELMVAMQIIGSNNQSIVCVAVLLEQTMDEVNTAISHLPLALALLSGTISLVATIMRASVGNGFLGAAATYGLVSEAISVHTPGLFDILFYTQFMLMTGQLSLNYPAFYSTFTGLFHWSFLQFRDTLIEKGPVNAMDVLTFGGSGSVNQIQGSLNQRNNGSSSASNNNLQRRLYLQEMEELIGRGPIPKIGTAEAAAQLDALQTTPPAHAPTHHLRKRQEPSPSGGTSSEGTTPAPSPSHSPSPPSSPSPSPTPSPSPSSSSSSSRTSSRRTSSSTTPPSTRTPPVRPTTSSETSDLIIPTITDPFTISVQHNVSRFGMQAYAAAIGAYPSALFQGTLINAILAACGSLVISALLLSLAWIMAKENHQRGKTLQHAFNFVAGNLLRIWFLLYTPLALTAMYQLTISGGAVWTTVSAMSLLIVSVGATIFFTWRILRASSELLLFDDLGTLLKYGTLYNTLAQEGTLFFLVTLLARFLWGLAVSMLSSFGIAQVAVLMVVELGYLVVIGVKWPFSESGDNKFHLFLGIIRVVITGCSISYIHELDASPEFRQLFAYIQMSLHLAVFIVMFALALWNLIQVCMFWKMRHSDAWKGPTKTYNFEDPIDDSEQGWGLSAVSGSDGYNRAKNRRFTVQSYSSLGSSSHGAGRGSIQAAMHGPSYLQQHHDDSDDDVARYGSPAERYRQARLVDHHRSRFAQPASSEGGSGAGDALADRRFDSRNLLTGPNMMASGSTSLPSRVPLQDLSSDTESSVTTNPLQSSTTAGNGLAPHRESYANFQRMSHQQSAPDPRTRRMSDITRDGPYLYNSRKEEQDSSAPLVPEEPKQSVWIGVKASLGKLFRFSRRSSNTPTSDGSKPKAFEVMRPPRRHYAPEQSTSGSVIDETGSQVGGDQPQELNKLVISRFFQESDRGYEKNRNLFVANPSAMISRTGSMVSTTSGAVPQPKAPSMRLTRNGSGAAESIRTLHYTRSRGGTGVGSTLGPNASGAGTIASSSGPHPTATNDRGSLNLGAIGGLDSSISEHGGNASISDRGSRRTSSALMPASGSGSSSQLYPPRHSAESSNNIAEALTIEAPLLLQGGGILKVSKGPEKTVQYWHKESGQYVESTAESLKERSSPQMDSVGVESTSSTPSTTPSPIQTRMRQDTSSSTKTRSMVGSSGGLSSIGPSSGVESPTDSSQPSPNTNVAISAGRMHEILGRMFSDHSVRLHSDHEHDSDSILTEDTASTFSAQASGRRSSLLQHTHSQHTQDGLGINGAAQADDAQSIDRYDMLEPVLEDSDVELEGQLNTDSTLLQPDSNSLDVGAIGAANEKATNGDGAIAQSELVKRASSTATEKRRSSVSLMRTFSGPIQTSSGTLGQNRFKPKHMKSFSSRPLAQSPLHSPSVQLGTAVTTSGPLNGAHLVATAAGADELSQQSSMQSVQSGIGPKFDFLDAPWVDGQDYNNNDHTLNRNASIATMRTEASYVTARSQYPSEEEDSREGL
ncbi:hypothetical protein BG011_000467 [Mortierella polycephala]|uniref:TRP C-terminal domain-containing protein n=1 Tax=Mortierella polycephala TaxID=41804 RepID=A0A9P6QID1_9FUNG|nr:hypothetical protein BG011_000467 [Mortierella polycephala]